MTQYDLHKRTAFSIKGEKDTYIIKPIGQMSVDEIEAVSKITDKTPLKEQAPICKEFVDRECPGIEKEGIGDLGYIDIVNAYFSYEKNGTVKAGE